MAGRTQSGLNLETSTSASIRPSLCDESSPFCMVKARLFCVIEIAESLDVILDNPAGLHK